jgi:tetratricopeptide (TPR) repeat protein
LDGEAAAAGSIEMHTAPVELPVTLIESLEKRLASNPHSPAFARLASLYLEVGRLEESLGLCEKGIVYYPEYAMAHLLLGQCYLRMRRLDEAKKEFSETLVLQPKCETARTLLQSTTVAEKWSQMSSGEPTYEEEQRSPLGNEIATPTLAEIYAAQGAYREAIRTYTQLADRRPEDRGRFEQRIRELEEIWRSLTPQN